MARHVRWPQIPTDTMPEFDDRLDRNERDSYSRVVVDAEGSEWIVREVDTPQPWAHGSRCLIFSSSAVVRRVWRYPAGWAGLPSRALLELGKSTVSV